MQLNRYLDFKRLFLQIKNDFYRSYRTWLITVGAITGILMAIDLLPGIVSGNPIIPTGTYYLLFLAGGFIFSSGMFVDMHDPKKGLVYLTTPASELERFLSKFLISNIFYILVAFIYFIVLTYLLKGINGLLFQNTNGEFIFNWETARIYFILQSIFLFAGSYFQKHAFLKLVFVAFILNLVLSFYSVLNVQLIFGSFENEYLNMNPMDLSVAEISEFAQNIFQVAKFTFNWLLAPYFWILTYLRIREKEV